MDALKKFIKAKNLVYTKVEAEDTNFLFNCETQTTLNNIDEMIKVRKESEIYSAAMRYRAHRSSLLAAIALSLPTVACGDDGSGRGV